MSLVVGSGKFYSWPGGCLFIGRDVGVVPVHAHHAIQIVFGSEPGVRLRARDGDPWASFAGAVVRAHQPHSLDATGVGMNAVIFVEPETRQGAALGARCGHGGIVPVSGDALAGCGSALFDAWLGGRDDAAVLEAVQRVVAALAGEAAPGAVLDERLLRAIGFLHANLDRSPSLEETAAVACLSPSRFRHLFVEATGMGLRPYILWLRLRRSWELIATGASLSAAAHGVGFADAAHLTRTCRRMLGIPPSALRVADAPGGISAPRGSGPADQASALPTSAPGAAAR